MPGSSGIEKINIPEKLGDTWTPQEANQMLIVFKKIADKLNQEITKLDDHEQRITNLGG